MQETPVQSLGWEDPLEKGKATHSSILAWRIPRTVQSMGSQRVRHNWATFTFIHEIKTLAPWKRSYDKPRQNIKKQRHYFTNKGPSSQSYAFFNSHVWMWELDYKESWALKNWCFWTMVLEKTFESPLDCKAIQLIHPKGDQSWIFIARTDAKAETPVLWPPHAKSWLIGKDSDTGRDWGQEEKGTTEDEMFGWHHRLDGHEFECTPGVGGGQGGLECCNSWGRKERDTSERLNWLKSYQH